MENKNHETPYHLFETTNKQTKKCPYSGEGIAELQCSLCPENTDLIHLVYVCLVATNLQTTSTSSRLNSRYRLGCISTMEINST